MTHGPFSQNCFHSLVGVSVLVCACGGALAGRCAASASSSPTFSLCMIIFGLHSNALKCYCIRSGLDHIDHDVRSEMGLKIWFCISVTDSSMCPPHTHTHTRFFSAAAHLPCAYHQYQIWFFLFTYSHCLLKLSYVHAKAAFIPV